MVNSGFAWSTNEKPIREIGIVSQVHIPHDAAISALRNGLWHESRFREDLISNRYNTLEDALHRATRYIEMEEEKIALNRKHAPPPKVLAQKDKQKDEYNEPRQHYDRDYANDKSRKATAYLVTDS